jgi:hypothetical protein
MKRADLDGLDREALIRLAEEHGVSRARILTRPELVDEILLRRAARDGDADPSIARGFFGLARDLVARVVERGLHLPDAATKIRSIHLDAPKKLTPPAVLPTVTLAQIYASQGHTSRAIDTLKRVIEAEPDHADALDLLRRLSEPSYIAPKDPLPPEDDAALAKEEDAAEERDDDEPVAEDVGTESAGSESDASAILLSEPSVEPISAAREPSPPPDAVEPLSAESSSSASASPDVEEERDATKSEPLPPAFLDDAPLPPKYDVDECVAIPVDPETLFAYWEVRDSLLAKLREVRGEGVLALRALVVEPGWHGPRTYVRDHDVHGSLGDYFLRGLPPAAVVRVAIGYRTSTAFVPIAHSPLLAIPRKEPVGNVAHTLVRWTATGTTVVLEDDVAAGFLARALRRASERGGSAAEVAAELGLPELGRFDLSPSAPRPAGSSHMTSNG